MATIGQQLPSPEKGWKRYRGYDTRMNLIKPIGSTANWSTSIDRANVSGLITNYGVSFKFYGSKIYLLGYSGTNRTVKIKVSIDGVETDILYSLYGSYQTDYVFFTWECSNVGIHTVDILLLDVDSRWFGIDVIDIDSTGYLIHQTLNQVDNLDNMQVGDCIPCRYTATSGVAGAFSELGTCTASEIPVTSTATPDGLFYFIKVDKGTLIADRIVQNSISWDALNNAKYIEGKNNPSVLNFIDGGTTYGINYDITRSASTSSSIVYNNELYCTWHEMNNKTNQIRVKKYDGSVWTFVDGNKANGINYDASKSAGIPTIMVYNNELYCTWHEMNNNNITQIRVKKYDGSTWEFIDDNGINYDASYNASVADLLVYNNELYCTWQEQHSSTMLQIRVKKYDGSVWTFVDGNGVNGINYNVNNYSTNPKLVVYNDELYCTWQERNSKSITQIRVKKYDGLAWEFVDGNGINYDVSKSAGIPCTAVHGNELYCAWYEMNDKTNQIRVKKYDGSTWTFVDGNGINGINYDASKSASNPKLVVYNNELYCTWKEGYMISMKKYNGSSWISVDNGFGGINYYVNCDKETGLPSLIIYNNKLYISWYEYNGVSLQIRFKNYKSTIYGNIRSLSGGCAYTDANGNPSLTDKSLGAWPVNNEWDKYIVNSDLGGKITSGDINIWNYDNTGSKWSWCKETGINGLITLNTSSGAKNTSRVIRKIAMDAPLSSLSNSIYGGFRPVLNYIESDIASEVIY